MIDAQRPVIINSIVDVATKSDLLDRAIVLELEPIPRDKRRDEEDFWGEFSTKQALILGALCEAASCALRRLPEVELTDKPRMADFAKWITAAEPSLGMADGAFLTMYLGNQQEASVALLDSLVAQAVTRFVDVALEWNGTPTELYTTLTRSLDESARQGQWPGSANRLMGEVRRMAPALRTAGYQLNEKRTSGKRLITLSKA